MRTSSFLRLGAVTLAIVALGSCATTVRRATDRSITSTGSYVVGRFTEDRTFLSIGPSYGGRFKNVDTGELYEFGFSPEDELAMIELPIGRYIVATLYQETVRRRSDGTTYSDKAFFSTPEGLEIPFVVLDGQATYIGDLHINSRWLVFFTFSEGILTNNVESSEQEFSERFGHHGIRFVPSAAMSRR